MSSKPKNTTSGNDVNAKSSSKNKDSKDKKKVLSEEVVTKPPVMNEEPVDWSNYGIYNDYPNFSSKPPTAPAPPPTHPSGPPVQYPPPHYPPPQSTTTTTTSSSSHSSSSRSNQPSNSHHGNSMMIQPRQITISMPAHTLPPSARQNGSSSQNVTITATLPAMTPFPGGKKGADFHTQFASQQSVYGSGATSLRKQKRYFRRAAGEIWEDPSLGDWPDDDFRIFCGDLGNEVTDDVLKNAFIKYPSYLKCKVIRDLKTGKTRGYGFVSLSDPQDYVKAMREMNGKYVGNRPIKLRKSSWRERTDVEKLSKKRRTS